MLNCPAGQHDSELVIVILSLENGPVTKFFDSMAILRAYLSRHICCRLCFAVLRIEV